MRDKPILDYGSPDRTPPYWPELLAHLLILLAIVILAVYSVLAPSVQR